MGTKRIELRIDRIEDGIAVAFDRNGNEYTISANIADVKESDIIDATVNEQGEIINLAVLTDKTKAIKLSLKDKLKYLFNK